MLSTSMGSFGELSSRSVMKDEGGSEGLESLWYGRRAGTMESGLEVRKEARRIIARQPTQELRTRSESHHHCHH